MNGRMMNAIQVCALALIFSASVTTLYFGLSFESGLITLLGLFGLGCAVSDGRHFVERLRHDRELQAAVDDTLRLQRERTRQLYERARS